MRPRARAAISHVTGVTWSGRVIRKAKWTIGYFSTGGVSGNCSASATWLLNCRATAANRITSSAARSVDGKLEETALLLCFLSVLRTITPAALKLSSLAFMGRARQLCSFARLAPPRYGNSCKRGCKRECWHIVGWFLHLLRKMARVNSIGRLGLLILKSFWLLWFVEVTRDFHGRCSVGLLLPSSEFEWLIISWFGTEDREFSAYSWGLWK